jgi:hypothetical protein
MAETNSENNTNRWIRRTCRGSDDVIGTSSLIIGADPE